MNPRRPTPAQRSSVRTTLIIVCIAFAFYACDTQAAMDRRSNVRPPAPGTPAGVDNVTGIYRSIHQGLLQLRADGSFVLVVPEGPGPSAGTFTLENGRLRVRTDKCGDQTGSYDLFVTGEPEAGKAMLNFLAVDDPCADRLEYLTADPWIYANS